MNPSWIHQSTKPENAVSRFLRSQRLTGAENGGASFPAGTSDLIRGSLVRRRIRPLFRVPALSLDGHNWEIQYARIDEARFRIQHSCVNPNLRFTLVATIENVALKTGFGHPFAPSDSVDATIDHLYTAVTDASLPFDAADDYEYWLLDEADSAPLALLQACVAPEDRDLVPWQASWVAGRLSALCSNRRARGFMVGVI